MISKPLAKEIQDKLDALVRKKAAPGFQLGLGFKDRSLGYWCSGVRDVSRRAKVHSNTWFDLASLSKILSTTYLVIWARQQKAIPSLDEPIGHFIPSFASGLKQKTIRDLLNHRSGLMPVFEKTEELPMREEKIRFFLATIDREYKDEPPVYSDVGFMLLGMILENVFGKRLRDIWKFHFPETFPMQFGPLRFDWFRTRARIQSLMNPEESVLGIVQDPRAHWLEGDAGHAGLFGSVEGVELWAERLFRAYHGKDTLLSETAVRELIDFSQKKDDWSFLNGFDTPAKEKSQAGSSFPSTTIGHLGYTGTSFWMDMESGARITLLSHRFWSGFDAQTLRDLRPSFHDWIWKEVLAPLKN